ncbi:DinB family protein [Chitinophaga sp. 22321]|uniref:DinB family protein n=1 Tax=Chitinophaga hostae TaxID=2831022 RepID=A0ABS5J6E7_9BACT|nr:DinB family protein [Chitinophaga hostae]MBS0030798.1 DinB family protein [Chitinophaga hostae]
MKRTAWFERVFPAIADNGRMPTIIERLSGTPARVEEMTRLLAPTLQTQQLNDKWSVKEQVGHLGDMEPLWSGRFDDFVNGLPELRVADLTNQQTHTANHNATDIAVLWQRFREQREQLVKQLRQLPEEALERTALHPRLKTPMRIIDLAYFVAEHDDHHLADIREITG